MAFADSMEKMDLGSMDFPVSRGSGAGWGGVRNGNSKDCSGVFPSPPEPEIQKRTWGLPHYLMTELHHVRSARLLLHLPQRKGEQRERQAAGGQPGKREPGLQAAIAGDSGGAERHPSTLDN